MKLSPIVKWIIKEQTPCYFISPHLDDAIYSAGSLISYLSGKVPVKIISVFTQTSPPPYTLSARRNLQVCGFESADKLFELRRKEDVEVCNSLGIEYSHLGLTDALWRKKSTVYPLVKFAGIFFPELLHFYPIYKFNVLSGRIARGDITSGQIESRLKRIIPVQKGTKIFVPLAIGTHIDHFIVRQSCINLIRSRHSGLSRIDSGVVSLPRMTNCQLIYWLDFPYYLELNDDIKHKIKVMKLQIFDWRVTDRKNDLILGYKSQVAPTFPGGKIPQRPEYFFY